MCISIVSSLQEKKELASQLMELDQKWAQCQGSYETEKQRCVQLESQLHIANAKCEKVSIVYGLYTITQ